MRLYIFAVVLGLAFMVPSHAAEKPRPAQTNQTQPKKVWTNEDMDDLRARGLISVFAPETQQAQLGAAPVSPAVAQPSRPTALPVYNSRLEDPAWYSQQAADLQAELDRRQALLRRQQTALALAARGITQPGLALDQPSFGVTPEAALDVLQASIQQVQSQLDELSDLARLNGIPPGVLRG